MRNGSRLLVGCSIAPGATKNFGVPKESHLAVLDAPHDAGGRLGGVLCRNEGGAAFMASAHGEPTASPGTCSVTRGPGATNAGIAAAPKALTPRRTLSQMRDAALVSREAKA